MTIIAAGWAQQSRQALDAAMRIRGWCAHACAEAFAFLAWLAPEISPVLFVAKAHSRSLLQSHARGHGASDFPIPLLSAGRNLRALLCLKTSLRAVRDRSEPIRPLVL
jgi:hypothetical protein